MQKNIGIIGLVIFAVLVLVIIWAVRGRPAGEEPGTVAPIPAATTAQTPTSPTRAPSATISPAAGLQSTAIPAGAVTVSITASGFSQPSVTVPVPVGGSVTFTNADTAPHQVASNPHPIHTNFPELNGPVLSAGQSHAVTFTRAGTFGYHDHLNPGIQGTILVQ